MDVLKYITVFLTLFIYFIYLMLIYVYEFFVKIFFGHIPSGSMRVRKIFYRFKIDPEEISRATDFMLAPGSLENPDDLDHPNWHLYCIDEATVTFVYLKFPISHYSIAKYPFMFEPVHKDALKVAQLSHSDFIHFARTLEQKPQPKTILFTNTARCGSTLMAKMLNHDGKSTCFGEPHALSNLAIMDNEKILSSEALESLVNATIICLRTHIPSNEICVLKTTSGEARLVPYSAKTTNLKHFFMFRKNGLTSVERVVRREEVMNWYLLNLYKKIPSLARFISNLIAMEGEHIRLCQPENIRHLSAIVYASPLSFYEKNISHYCHPIIWHHDIIGNTEKTIESLFTKIEIPLECISAAVNCKSEDSQKDSFLSIDKLKNIKIPPLSDEDYCKLHILAKKMGISGNVFEEN